jgi:hypothetical protein
MMQTVQVPCPSCQQLTWVSPGYAIPCQHCQTPVSAPGVPGVPGAPAAGPELPQAPAPTMKVGGFSLPIGAAGGGISRTKLLFGVVATVALALGGWFVKDTFLPKKGVVSYSKVGGKSPVADELYKALASDATKWKRDSFFWSLNYHAVRPDGTVDTSQPTVVTYVSPSNSASSLKQTRSKSLRQYGSNPKGMKVSFKGWNKPVHDIEPHPEPTCTIKQLVGKLHAEGVIKSPVRVSFDPRTSNYYAWTIYMDDKHQAYSWKNCAPIK